MTTYQSGISIIIPTEGRLLLTCRLIQNLDALREKVEFPTEVLVIDSSQRLDCQIIEETCIDYHAKLIKGPANVRKKRNLGIVNANYSIVLFLDSDCDPQEDLLEQHWQVYQQNDNPDLGGVLGKLEFVGAETLAWRLVKNSSLVQHFNQTEVSYVKWGPTANLSIYHEVLDSIGLFDDTFPFILGGDDLDLTYRLTSSGWKLVSCPEALVYHDRSTWSNLNAVFSRAMRWGRMEYYLYKKHSSLQIPHPPSFLGWLIFISLFSLISAIFQQSWQFLALPVTWMFFSIMFFSLCIFLIQEGSFKEKRIVFRESLLSSFPELIYQLGSTYEFLRHGDLRFFYSRPLLNSNGITGIWAAEAWNTWSNLLAFFVCYLALVYLIGFA